MPTPDWNITDYLVDYHAQLDITNLDQLPRGTGCKYLLVIEGQAAGSYIAKKWLRTLPKRRPQRIERIVRL